MGMKNNTKISTFTCVLIFVVIIGSLLLVNNFNMNKTAFAGAKKTKFNGADFKYLRRQIQDMLMCLKQIREPSQFHQIGCIHSGIHTK
jgi:hypothetical protein